MLPNVKQLTLTDLILNRPGTFTFHLILLIFSIALKLFFRRIETVNAGIVPEGTGVIFVSNHPNGLIDPALVFVALPRKISFLAKSTLFRMPVISFLLRTVEALPLYRRIDAGEDVSKNQQTFELSRAILKKGGSIALFPEGVSHNSPKILPAKTGAARIALGAVSMHADEEPIGLKIVPVGLYYTNKTTFRSEALLHFGSPFDVLPVALDTEGQPPREDVKKLTSEIENALREVTLNAESESELHTAHIAEQIFATAANENLGEKLDFLKNYVAETSSDKRSDKDVELERRLIDFDARLEDVGLEPQHLSLARLTRGFVFKQAIVQTWFLLLLTPIAIVGSILHFPAYRLCKLFAKHYSRHGSDDIASTVKVLAGVVFMPLTWLIVSILIGLYWGCMFALLSIPLSFLFGYVALYTLEELEELRGWAKAIWRFLADKNSFVKLYIERRELQSDLREFD
ncbi:MAG: lysophospholipid acyltransferase family protein [Blastocatellia bacterium]